MSSLEDLPSILSSLAELEPDASSALLTALQEGHVCIESDAAANHPLLHRWGPYLYPKRHWILETRIIDHLSRLQMPLPSLSASSSDLSEEQQKALELALSHPISLITGGPGTGKTHVARSLAKAVTGRTVLAAPTGKAAARLQSVRTDALCGTLHSVLGIRSARDLVREGSYLKADLLIIDESSMIDLSLFAFLLSSIRRGTRIVFLGDADQLPSVGSGSIFADLENILPTARLTHCFRSDQAQILSLADAVRRGDPEPVLAALTPFEPSENTTILSCLRKGTEGVSALNHQMAARVMGRLGQNEEAEIPILITRTDYDKGLYNGETGVLIRNNVKPLYARFSDGRIFNADALPPYEYAFALSVHKSQGSEFDHVAVLVPPGSEVFGREVLYTAITRARRSVTISGDAEVIRQTILTHSRKISGLRARLQNR
ncbi:MAG: AAA family ATPase [Verrucomicrobia bacterium]|nr:AAA family ATPase [Verrucomicrobiota bacterium]